MNPILSEWLELIIRWAHVFAGIMWVGATYYFTWLDGRFEELEKEAGKPEEERKFVWMVHSGGFYAVEKMKVPKLMPAKLHWFRWEAGLTWITGMLLFGLIYWHGKLLTNYEETAADRLAFLFPFLKNATVLTPVLEFMTNHYLIVSVVMILAAWVIYDLLWGRVLKPGLQALVVSYLVIVLAAIVSCVAFPGRAAYMQLGAMLGTIMAANVWMRIIPAQRRMVAALKAGQAADLSEGTRAKTRSKHNTFIVMPVVFIMISSHYPGTYGSPKNWLVLSVLVLAGWGAAKWIRKA
jgi:uncharacterized membrane protein